MDTSTVETVSSEPEGGSAQDRPATQTPRVCLAGVPNAGKTALMNALTGGSFHTANYPGITVSLSRGRTKPEFGPEILLVDLPGVYSSVPQSPEEELSCEVLEGRHPTVLPEAMILVVDATQLERQLKFAAYAARSGRPVVIALTMTDLLSRSGQAVDPSRLAKALGVPVVPVDGRTGWGTGELIEALRHAIGHSGWETPLALVPDEPVAGYEAVRNLIEHSGALRGNPLTVLQPDAVSSRIDRVVLNRYLGFPIFLLILGGLFASIFWAAQPFMDGVEALFAWTGQALLGFLPESVISRFVSEGLIGGVGAVAVFLPQIVILFLLMTLLEDSGYLSRGAALVDRPLSFLGLHGRSFVPMLSGFACAIPAVFASRTIPSKRERLLTIWILPLMSCSARLPVYALLLAALLPGDPWAAGLGLSAIYLSSLLAGALTAGLIGRFAFRDTSHSILAMELPAYRKPLFKPVLKITWSRSSSYLKRAGLPIVVISAILWALSNFGLGSAQPRSDVAPRAFLTESHLDNSLAAQLGHTIEPALAPMGVDWRVGVGLISAFAAREVFVSSMAIVFHVTDSDAPETGLLEKMRAATLRDSSKKVFTPSSIVGLIVFFFFSLQCLATVAVVRSETNSWRFAALQLLFYTGLGYVLSVITVQGLRAFGVA